MASTATLYSLGSSGSRARPKKRKHRIVNLRKNKDEGHTLETASVGTSGYDESASQTGSSPSVVRSGTQATSAIGGNAREGEISTPPRSPKKKVDFHTDNVDGAVDRPPLSRSRPCTPKTSLPPLAHPDDDLDRTPRASMYLPKKDEKDVPRTSTTANNAVRTQAFPSRSPSPEISRRPPYDFRHSSSDLSRTSSDIKLQSLLTAFSEGGSGGILERAWLEKMATEIAKKVEQGRAEQKAWRQPSEERIMEEAPPAYVS